MMVRIIVFSAIMGLAQANAAQRKSNNNLKTSSATRYFQFNIRNFSTDESFVAATSDSMVLTDIDQQLALPENQRFLHIHGPIDSTNGGHNFGWSWHFVPDQWLMAENSIELCDGRPSIVETDLQNYLHVVGSYCPWASYVFVELDGCCVGSTGNINGNAGVDIADLTFLIDHLFINLLPLACPAKGNIDGDSGGVVDIADLTVLIDHLFINFPPTAACQ